MSRKDLWLAAAFGVAALTIGIAYLYSGPLRQLGPLPENAPEWLFGPVGVTGVAVAFYMGLRRSRSVRPFPRLVSAVTWAAAWCLLMGSPWLARYADLYIAVRRLPLPAASKITLSIDPVIGDRREDFVIIVTPLDPPAEIVRFYEAEMRRRGWTAAPADIDMMRQFHDADLSGQTNVRFERGRRVCVIRMNVYSPGNDPRANVMLLSPDLEVSSDVEDPPLCLLTDWLR